MFFAKLFYLIDSSGKKEHFIYFDAISGDCPNPTTALTLLHTVYNKVGKYYQDAQAIPHPEKRLEKATALPQQSVTSKQLLQATLGRTPGFGEINQPRHRYSLDEGKKELTALYDFHPDFKKIVDREGKPDRNRQEMLLRALGLRPHTALSLSHCVVLTDELLQATLRKSTNLSELNLRHCSELTDASIIYLTEYHPTLKSLTLSDMPKITSIQRSRFLFPLDPLPLPFRNLEVLKITRCEKLASIKIDAPALRRADLEGCPQLPGRVFLRLLLYCPQLPGNGWLERYAIRLQLLTVHYKYFGLDSKPNWSFAEGVITVLRGEDSSFGLRSYGILVEGLKIICGLLKRNSTLTSLDLWGNKIGAAGAQALSEALKKNSTLTSLDLRGNNIGDAGAQALSEMLKGNHTLTKLSLQGNNIGIAGAQALSEMLKENRTLTSLNPRENNIGAAGAQALSEMLKENHTLTLLNLGINGIRNVGAQALSEMLKKNSTLTTLDLDGNWIGAAGAEALSEMLKENRTLTTLDLEVNWISATKLQALNKMLERNQAAADLLKKETAEKSRTTARDREDSSVNGASDATAATQAGIFATPSLKRGQSDGNERDVGLVDVKEQSGHKQKGSKR